MTAVDFAAFVEKLADVAGETIMPFFRTSIGAENKNIGGGMFNPVTEADRAAETAMRRLINATFPNHGIIGEEFGNYQTEAEYVWVLDPIDGTKSFIAGMPMWGTLIGLLHNGRPSYGMMVQPFTRERFSGDGKGARWRGPGHDHAMSERKLHTRSCDQLGKMTLMTTSPLLYSEDKLATFKTLENQVRLSRYGCDCYAFAMLAAGQVDCVVEAGLQPYDIIALVPIIEGAGGVVTTWTGGSPTQGGEVVATGDPHLHEQILKILSA